MFQYYSDTKRDFNHISLKNDKEDFEMKIIPGYGANLCFLKLSGIELIDGFKNNKECMEDTGFKNALLFPFPNRLKDGAYIFENKKYQFPINEPERDNALHGFLYNRPFKIKNYFVSDLDAGITLTYVYSGDIPAYPFPCDIEVSYSLSVVTGFRLGITVQNKSGGTMPVGLGWHPYFKIGQDSIDGFQLSIPSHKEYKLDKQLIPSHLSLTQAGETLRLENKNLDNAYKISDESTNQSYIYLEDRKNNRSIKFWQEAGEDKFNYFQIYTPTHRKSIAIEPMSCSIDAFNSKDGLIVLKPGQKIEMNCGVELVGNLQDLSQTRDSRKKNP